MDTIYENNLDQAILAKVKGDFFPDDSPIIVDESLEGQTVRDGRYVIGPWAGPGSDIHNLFHEMGHFADREIEALLEYPFNSWGYSFGRPWSIAGQSGFEPQTDQSVRREMNCWAYQVSLSRHYGCEQSTQDVVRSAVYLDAFMFYKMEEGRQLEYKDRNKFKLSIMADEVEKLTATTHTFSNFLLEWNKRIYALKKDTL